MASDRVDPPLGMIYGADIRHGTRSAIVSEN